MRSTLSSPSIFPCSGPASWGLAYHITLSFFFLPVTVVLLWSCLNLTARSSFTASVSVSALPFIVGMVGLIMGLVLTLVLPPFCLALAPAWHLACHGLGQQNSRSLTPDCSWRLHDQSSRRTWSDRGETWIRKKLEQEKNDQRKGMQTGKVKYLWQKDVWLQER